MEYFTQAKKIELEKELEELTTIRRKEVADSLNYAKSLGDLSENAEYHQAREDQAYVEDRISQLEAMLKDAVVMDAMMDGIVHVGSTVTLKKDGEKSTITYTVVGTSESDVKVGKISNESPIGRALLGKREGESCVVETPKGEIGYKIVRLG